MKNLKKLSRNNLKEIHGGNFTGGCNAHLVTVDEAPGEGMPHDCGCKTLLWCEKLSACLQSGQYAKSCKSL